MRSNILLTLILAFTLSFSVLAKDVSKAQAEKVAVNFYYERSNIFHNAVDYYDLSIKEVRKTDDAYYAVNFENGWVLIAADDAMVPVLGYDFNGQFAPKDKLDYNVKSFIQTYVDEINYIRENNIEADAETEAQWNYYLNSDQETLLSFRGDRDQVGPLMTVTWNQDYPYNILCPEDDNGPGGHVYVGCVATAMAQVMYFWRYPLQGTGSYSYYQYPYGTLSFNYGEANFEFNAMQDAIDGGNPWEVAEIGYAAAISVHMDFSPNGSGAYSSDVPNALRNYFNYDNACSYKQKQNYSNTVWMNMMKGELDLGRVIYYSGYSSDGGHAFVCDGYNSSNYFHFNFGWGGSTNGFYSLTDVNGFNSGQAMVYQIYPDDPDYPYIPDEQVLLTSISGSFTDGSGPIEDYPSNWSGSWLIDPQTETDSIVSVSVHFVQFDTDPNDYVRIYDGETTDAPLLAEYSGSDVPSGTINSTGNKMLITFTTTGTGAGFKAMYNTTAPSYCQSTEVYTEPSGTITDGSSTFNYNNQTSCIFILQVPEAVNYHINFTEFATEEGKDIVSIYNGDQDLIGEYSGSELPDPIEIATDMVIILWSTNSTVTDDGWSFDYTVDGVGVQENFEYDNLSIYPNPTNGQLNVAFDIEKAEQLEIQLYNMSGQVIMKDVVNGFNGHYQNSFDLSNLSKGVYVLSIVSDKGKVEKKVVLK